MDETLGTDYIVSSLLSELKSENDRKDVLIKRLLQVLGCCITAILLTVAGFLLYLNQYDFISTEEINASGVYTLVDSKGNVIAHDLTPEDISLIMEEVNGQGTSEENQSEG